MARSGKKIGAEKVAEAIRKTGGVLAAAARALGCDRSTIHRYVNDYATVREAYEEANETNLDIAEGKLLEQVRAGDPKQIQFFLRTKGRSRGYGDKMEVTGEDGGAIPIVIKRVNRPDG
jgi:hypothetical protein